MFLKHCPNGHCESIERFDIVAEFVDDVERCSHCRTELVDGPAPDCPPEIDWEDLVQVASYLDVHSAYATQSALRAAGIRAFVKDEYFAGMRWDYAIALGGVRVLVPLPQEAFAKELIGGDATSEVDAIADSSEPADTMCPRCHSRNLAVVIRGRVPALVSVCLLGIPLLFRRELVHCSNCQAEYTP